jgi:hypothetical protein
MWKLQGSACSSLRVDGAGFKYPRLALIRRPDPRFAPALCEVALEALKGEVTLSQLATKHGGHQTMIAAWRKQAVEGLTGVFSGKAEAGWR